MQLNLFSNYHDASIVFDGLRFSIVFKLVNRVQRARIMVPSSFPIYIVNNASFFLFHQENMSIKSIPH